MKLLGAYNKNTSGVALKFVLGIVAILAVTALMIIFQGQTVRTAVLGRSQTFEELIAAQNAENVLLTDLSEWTYNRTPPQSKTYSTEDNKVDADVSWNPNLFQGSRSDFGTFPRSYSSFDHLFPNYGEGKGKDKFSPGHLEGLEPLASYLDLTNTAPLPIGHSRAKIQVGRRTKEVTYSPYFPYSVYAPQGRIDVDRIKSYNNPAYEMPGDTKTPTLGPYNGKTVRLFADGEVQVDRVDVARIESRQGPIRVERGAALSEVRRSPEHVYARLLEKQLRFAMADMRTRGADKTGLIIGRPLSIAGMAEVLEGRRDLYSVISLEQAMQIPFPILPRTRGIEGFRIICLSLPMPSDWTGFKMAEETAERMETIAKSLVTAGDENKRLEDEALKAKEAYDEANSALKKLEQEIDDLEDPRLRKAEREEREAKVKRDRAVQASDDAQREVERLTQQLTDTSNEATDHFNNGTSRDFGQVPQTSRQDSEYSLRKGYFGWAYFRFFSAISTNIGGFIQSIIRGQKAVTVLDRALENVLFPSRVIHFSGRRPELWSEGTTELRSDQLTFDRPAWAMPNGSLDYNSLRATWSIQPGKAARLRGDWQLDGDLWLRRGSFLHVRGNLQVTKPVNWPKSEIVDDLEGLSFQYKNVEAKGPFRPTGRIILEEGSCLMVDGDLTAFGSRELGSITATASYGLPSHINRSVLCGGDVKFHHGIQSGILVEDLLVELGDFGKSALNDFQVFFNRLLPFLSRSPFVTGPFKKRRSYFAQYAFTVQIISVQEVIGIPRIYTPIPLPYDNCLRGIFNKVALGYGINLNWQLGPWFMTHSSMWPWGKGSVPALPKVDPKVMKDEMKNFSPPKIDKNIVDQLPKMILHVLSSVGQTVIKEALTGAAQEALAAGGFSTTCGGGGDSTSDSKLKKGLKTAWKAFGGLKKLNSIRKLAQQHFKVAADEATRTWKDELASGRIIAEESPGVFVYAGDSMEVGTTVSSGWLVANGNLTVNSDIFIGTLMSLHGDVRAKTVHSFPYYSVASIYRPPIQGTSAWDDLIQMEIPKGTDIPHDIGLPILHRQGRLWK